MTWSPSCTGQRNSILNIRIFANQTFEYLIHWNINIQKIYILFTKKLMIVYFNLPNPAFNFALSAFSLLTRWFKLVTRWFELVTCGFELVTRGFELVTRGFELVPRGFELVTRV